MEKKTIVVGCDNAAVDFKNMIKEFAGKLGYEVEDVGVSSAEDGTYYPCVAEKACKKIIESNYRKRGILICGTGMGMAMTANKFPGIFAAVCHDNFSAERSKLSNGANVLCFGARVIGYGLSKKIMKEWLSLNSVDPGSVPKVRAMHEIDERTRKLDKCI